MSIADAVVRFFSEGGPVAKRLPGFRPRAQQIEMAVEVARALEEPGPPLVVEAGTGTGKSLAYLSAALLSKRQVIISTGTKALQDQLVDKDIPLVLSALYAFTGEEKRAALMKGRNNYLCLLRYERFSREPIFAFAKEAKAFPALKAWAEKTSTGDRGEIEGLPDRWVTWSDLDASREICVGQKCPHFQDCFITRMRRRAEDADLIVVNHHLLCADQRVRLEGAPRGDDAEGAGGFAHVIPFADALIIDEAHALPDIASEYFGVSLSSSRVERLLRDLRRQAEGLPTTKRMPLFGAGQAAATAMGKVFEVLERMTPENERVRLRASATKDLDQERRAAAEALEQLSSQLESLALGAGAEGAVATYAVAELEGLRRRADQVVAELEFLLGRAPDDARFVAFAEGKRRGLALGAVPIDVSDVLEKTLLFGARPVVLTSATLAVAGQTRGFEERIGIAGRARAVQLSSPFDHARRSALYAPKEMPEPDHPSFVARFDDEVRFLLELTKGGALLLFTSHRALELAFARLGPVLEALHLEASRQGEAPKAQLLERLRASSGARGHVLFATHSFWEGVDVPGRALRLIVIDRLPFRIPTDPVQVARQELIRSRGGSPFYDLSLPEAALALKQGVGRLLRTTDDAGVVAVLDGRLRKKRYGRVFLDTLPPMTRIGARHALEAFWTGHVAPVLGL